MHLTYIDGSKCKTKAQLFKQFAKQFQFPSYFGKNWDAFNDCMTDLEWLDASGYALYISHFELLLADFETDLTIFIELLEDMIIEWTKGSNYGVEKLPQPFEVVIQGNRFVENSLRNKLKRLTIINVDSFH